MKGGIYWHNVRPTTRRMKLFGSALFAVSMHLFCVAYPDVSTRQQRLKRKNKDSEHNQGHSMFLYAAVPQENKWNLATDLNMSFLRFKAAEEREAERQKDSIVV